MNKPISQADILSTEKIKQIKAIMTDALKKAYKRDGCMFPALYVFHFASGELQINSFNLTEAQYDRRTLAAMMAVIKSYCKSVNAIGVVSTNECMYHLFGKDDHRDVPTDGEMSDGIHIQFETAFSFEIDIYRRSIIDGELEFVDTLRPQKMSAGFVMFIYNMPCEN